MNGKITFDIEKIREFAEKDGSGSSSKNTGKMAMDDVEKILVITQEKKGYPSREHTLMAIAGLAQSGGSNENAKSSSSYTYAGKTLTSTDLKTYINLQVKKGTIRQLCRTLASEIAAIAHAMGEEGDLAHQMRKKHANLSFEEAVWCSNFQTGNPDCPVKIRNYLMEN